MSQLISEQDGEKARAYLELLVIRHDANNDIRELEDKLDAPKRMHSDSEQLNESDEDGSNMMPVKIMADKQF